MRLAVGIGQHGGCVPSLKVNVLGEPVRNVPSAVVKLKHAVAATATDLVDVSHVGLARSKCVEHPVGKGHLALDVV